MRLMTSSNCALAWTRSSCCLRQKLIALLGFLVFLDGHQVHRADFVEPFLQGFDLLRDGVPIRGRARGGHFFRRHHMHLRRAFVGEGDGDALAAHVVEVDVIFLLDAFAQVLDGHVFLRQFHVQGAALFLQLGQLPPLLAQVFLARGDVGFLRLFPRQQFGGLRVHLLALVLQTLDLRPRILNFRFRLLLAADEG